MTEPKVVYIDSDGLEYGLWKTEEGIILMRRTTESYDLESKQIFNPKLVQAINEANNDSE